MKTHWTIESTNTWLLILIILHIMIKGSSYGETVSCFCTPNLLLFSFFSGRAVELAILTVVWIHVWTNQSQHNPTLGKVNLCMDAVAIWILLTLGALSTLPVFIWDRLCFSHLNMLLFFFWGGGVHPVHPLMNGTYSAQTHSLFLSYHAFVFHVTVKSKKYLWKSEFMRDSLTSFSL